LLLQNSYLTHSVLNKTSAACFPFIEDGGNCNPVDRYTHTLVACVLGVIDADVRLMVHVLEIYEQTELRFSTASGCNITPTSQFYAAAAAAAAVLVRLITDLKLLRSDDVEFTSAHVNFHEIKKNGVFWDVAPCGSCKNRRFGRT
jgi:hypothetical protein